MTDAQKQILSRINELKGKPPGVVTQVEGLKIAKLELIDSYVAYDKSKDRFLVSEIKPDGHPTMKENTDTPEILWKELQTPKNKSELEILNSTFGTKKSMEDFG